MSKLIVVVGATGNQGGSVAHRFLQDPNYRVRGLTRNTNSAAALALTAAGAEMVQANLDDASTLIPAFAGANLIFSVTNFWEPFFRPDCVAQAQEQGVPIGKFAYGVEYRQGVNIADAAAKTVHTLDENGFIASTLSSAIKCSGGKITGAYHFDSKSDVFPDYVQAKYPELARKMSCVQTGFFMTSYRLAMAAYFHKLPDGTFETRSPMSPSKPLPHLDVNADTGPFVHAVSRMAPGKHYMAAGTTCTWPEYCASWSKVTGIQCEYKQITLEEIVALLPFRELGLEIGLMYAYSDEPGYDGGMQLVGAKELTEAGFDCPMTSLADWMARRDWKDVLEQ